MTSGAVSPIANRSEANVRRRECGVSRGGSGGLSSLSSRSSAFSTALRKDALADVRGGLPAALTGREDQRLRPRVAYPCLVLRELVAERGQELDLAHASVGLRLTHTQASAREVDVTPAHGERLADPQPREHERGQERARRPRGL